MQENTVCALPWSHFILRENNTALPCCNYTEPGFYVEDGATANDILGHLSQEALRQQMLKGQQPAGCARCYFQEAKSGSSMRVNANREFPVVWRDQPKLRSLEFHLGNICNLKCRGCSSAFSSKWAGDEAALGKPAALIKKAQASALTFLESIPSGLSHLKLLGGEPFLFPEHEELLQLLEKKQNLSELTLEYATNGTQKVSDKILTSWNKLKKLQISFSVDGLRERNDFFRDGSRWQDVIDNIRWFEKYAKAQNVEFIIHTVVNIYNIHEIPQLDDWLLAEFPHHWLTKDCLYEPSWLSISCLPEEVKKELREFYDKKITEFSGAKKRKIPYQKIRSYLDIPSISNFSAFLKNDLALNKLRGHELKIVNAPLAELMGKY